MNATCPVCGNQDNYKLSFTRHADHLHVICYALVRVEGVGGRRTCRTEWDDELPPPYDGPSFADPMLPF